MTRSAAHLRSNAGTIVPALGVGVTYQPKMRAFIERYCGMLDFLEIVPDMLWEDRSNDAAVRYLDDVAARRWLNTIAQKLPVVAHSIGGSIGSAHSDLAPHLAQLKRWHNDFMFPWHSDHLAFNLALHDDSQVNVGITLPIARDDEGLELLCQRIETVQRHVPLPFAIENNVYFFDYPEQPYSDAEFLNALLRESGCYLILDLHNAYTNERNGFGRVDEFIATLDLSRVIEIHVAGGMEMDDVYLDAHSGPTPPSVIDTLHAVLPYCSNLGGITFEILGSWFEHCGDAVILDEIHALRELWVTRSATAQELST